MNVNQETETEQRPHVAAQVVSVTKLFQANEPHYSQVYVHLLGTAVVGHQLLVFHQNGIKTLPLLRNVPASSAAFEFFTY